MFYIYSIKNIENGKFYIGSRTAKCMLNRKPEDDLGVKYFSSSKDKELIQAIKDGKVEYHVLQEYDDIDVCWRAEQQLIALYWKFFGRDRSYNKRCDIDNNTIWSTAGTHPNNETRKKLSESHKGRTFSEESRKKLSESHKGIKFSEEHRKKLGDANRGEKNGWWGKQGPNKGRTFSEETRKKMSESRKGIKFSEEHRKKLSEVQIGRPRPKYYWKTPTGEIKITDKGNVHRWHKDWVLIGPVK